MSDFDLKWFLIGALALYLLQRFLGVLVVSKKSNGS